MQLLRDCRGKVSRREDAEPGGGFKSGHRLADRRQVRKHRLPLVAGHAVGAQLSGAHLLGPGHQADEHQVDLPAEQIGERRRRSLVRHVQKVDAGHQLELLACEMERRADAADADRQLVRLRGAPAQSAP
jgi:hypothetical protein